MANLINQSAARKLAKSLNIHLGTSGIKALNARIEEIISEPPLRSQKSTRKTILQRHVTR